MSDNLDDVFAALARSGSMSSRKLLATLNDLAYQAGTRGNGVVVEIGAYRGASTVALAHGLARAGRGRVESIDPHQHFRGVLGGVFAPGDHAVYEATLREHGVVDLVTHHCTTSTDVARNWSQPIDLLWIDGDHSYDGVTQDLACWLPFLAEDGVLVLDDHSPGSEVEAAVRDHLPFSRFLPVDRVGNALVLRRQPVPRTMVLCGGMQSGGSTLVSRCFLQRADMDGVYDMFNASIQQDFSRVRTPQLWVKMTIGAFRLTELARLYAAQGWQVKALLVERDPVESLASLAGKPYGIDGSTAEDPPLLLRFSRYMADVEAFRRDGRVVLSYAELLHDPEAELRRCCDALGLAWDPAMLAWPKPEAEFSYPSLGNPTLRRTMGEGGGLLEAIARYRREQVPGDSAALSSAHAIIECFQDGADAPLLPPVVFRGTRADQRRRESARLGAEARRLERIERHAFLGRFLRWWAMFFNPSLRR